MISNVFKILTVAFFWMSVVGITTYYSIDKDTVRIIRKSIRALNKRQYFKFEHLLYLVVKAGQLRVKLLIITFSCLLMYLFLIFLGV
jgi:hypothetical protein